MASFGRKNEPLTAIWVLGGPAVTSRERNALTGVGVGGGHVEVSVAVQPMSRWLCAIGAKATRTEAEAAAPNKMTAGLSRLGNLGKPMKPAKVTS
jgi:hypothetical protein